MRLSYHYGSNFKKVLAKGVKTRTALVTFPLAISFVLALSLVITSSKITDGISHLFVNLLLFFLGSPLLGIFLDFHSKLARVCSGYRLYEQKIGASLANVFNYY